MTRIIDRYLAREMGQGLALVAGVLVVMFASFSTARFMADAVAEGLGMGVVLQLVGLRTLIALEVLLPIALYLGVVMGLGRLHHDQEMTALQAMGVGEARVLRPVALLALPLAAVVALISLQARPWAYYWNYQLQAESRAELDLDRLAPERFQGSTETGLVIYARQVEPQRQQMSGVFLYRRDGERREIVLAPRASKPDAPSGEPPRLLLEDGTAYQLGPGSGGDRVLRFGQLSLVLEEPDTLLGYKRKAASNATLLASDDAADLAELQWRLSRPLSTVLLALLAVPLSRTAPRRGRHARLLAAVLAYAAYYNLGGIARTWVEQGTVGAFPGLWWPHALLALVLLALLWPRYRRAP